MEWVETTAKSIDEARAKALDLLNVDSADAEIEVIEDAKTNWLGRIKSEARVRARIKPKAPAPKDDRRNRRGGQRSRDNNRGGRSRDNRGGGDGRGGRNRQGGGGDSRGGGKRNRDDGKANGGNRGDNRGGGDKSRNDGSRSEGNRGDGNRGGRNDGGQGRKGRDGQGGNGGRGNQSRDNQSRDNQSRDDQNKSGGRGDRGGNRDRGGRSGGGGDRTNEQMDVPGKAGAAAAVAGGGAAVAATRGGRNDNKKNNRDRGDDRGRQEQSMDEEFSIEEQKDVMSAFVGGVAQTFDASASVTVVEHEEDVLEAQVTGDDLGLLLGPRGVTLSALEELTRTAMQRHAAGRRYARINVDVDGYRERRREALGRFATGIAEEVRDSGERKALESMNAADRKVVHDALSEMEGVETRSEGDDPRRYVVIVPAD